VLQTWTSYARAPLNVADLLAGDQRGGRPADVAGLEPVAPRGREVLRHLDLRDVRGELGVEVLEPVDVPGRGATRSACDLSVFRSEPKTRTTIGSAAPASTSSILSRR
jgi:hypothetical protein